MNEFWVFGYGSLIWNPGFHYQDKSPAMIHGYHRSLCVYSWVYRGTRRHPGLVLGLDRGGSCLGMAFRIAKDQWDDVIAYLRARELVTHVYLEREVDVRLTDGRKVKAVTYVADRNHVQYAGALKPWEAAQIVSRAQGELGPNRDYVLNTLTHLQDMGIRDHWLEKVAQQIEALSATDPHVP